MHERACACMCMFACKYTCVFLCTCSRGRTFVRVCVPCARVCMCVCMYVCFFLLLFSFFLFLVIFSCVETLLRGRHVVKAVVNPNLKQWCCLCAHIGDEGRPHQTGSQTSLARVEALGAGLPPFSAQSPTPPQLQVPVCVGRSQE